ncbi:sensor domain-containing diguanylate cyclase [Petrocella sp. FN5]|uniref:sensor domain-containing diguanylate cyclase n=1 Tax=Petrocella sp. FN5 TaxID=3032002 RepID=UPI0023DB4841|nr:sensor domain-containing diguanylate cyclase [Petrocella sp. FN5]MDF1618037.1 diguanylate cyclase [Petrocella sp. FN5]
MKENYLKNELYDLINNDTSIFEFIQSGSLDGIWYWDLENPEIEWMSPKFWETLGYNPDEKKHLASEWQDIIFQEDLKLAIENFERHCADPHHPYDQIVRYKHKAGHTIWIRCRGLAIRDENGKAIRMLGAHTDITDLKVAEKEISRLTEEYEKVFNGTQDAMFLMRVLENGEFLYIRNNLAHQNKTGILLEHIMNKSPQELLGKEMGAIVSENYRKCTINRTSITYEENLSLPGGDYLWLTTLTPIIEGTKVTHIVGSATDITERKKLELELEKQANYDKLTGLPNRRLFFERLERLVVENERDGRKFALLFIDLDGFKDINDRYGHEVGDAVLITVGKRLLTCIRKSDTVARMGGDEFTIVLRNIEDQENVNRLVKKIHTILQKVMHIDSIECKVNSSIGVAIYPENGRDSETLLRNADAFMYEIKRNGKGGYRTYLM